jgi:ribosomal protein L18E
MHKKSNFNVETLHVSISKTSDNDFVGTEFILSVTDEDMYKAKRLFLIFNDTNPIERTEFGEIYNKEDSSAIIYVNGIQVAEEENYMFNYNITKLSAAMKKALNRERSNVGRTAYAEIVKKLLLKSNSEIVISQLVNELKKLNTGEEHDEINYVDIQVHAMKTYNTQKPVVYVSQIDAYGLSNDDKEKIKESGRELVIVPQNAFDKIKDTADIKGNAMGTFDLVRKEYNENFEYIWVQPENLSPERKLIWEKRAIVMNWLKDKKWRSKIKISKTINEYTNGDTSGVYDSSEDAIIIKESVLDKESLFYEVLIHEYIHATTRYQDNSRDFENELGNIIGKMGLEIFSDKGNNKYTSDKIQEKNTSLFGNIVSLFKGKG